MVSVYSRQELVSHTFDLNTYRDIQQVYISIVTPILLLITTIVFISGCLYELQQKPSPSTNLKYSVALSLSCQSSPSLQSSLFCLSVHACMHNAYVNVTIFSKRYRQIYVHQGRIEPPQCVVYSPHALALGN